MATKPVVSRGGKMKQINNSVLDWLVGPFSKRPDQFDQDDWVRLHQANEDTLYYVQNHEEYLSKKALEESQPIFDPIKFPIEIPFSFLAIAITDVANSGILVPMAITVTEITASLTPIESALLKLEFSSIALV